MNVMSDVTRNDKQPGGFTIQYRLALRLQDYPTKQKAGGRPVAPELDLLAAYEKIQEDLCGSSEENLCGSSEENWLDLIVNNKDQIDNIIAVIK